MTTSKFSDETWLFFLESEATFVKKKAVGSIQC